MNTDTFYKKICENPRKSVAKNFQEIKNDTNKTNKNDHGIAFGIWIFIECLQ
jgi:hypothetical protein